MKIHGFDQGLSLTLPPLSVIYLRCAKDVSSRIHKLETDGIISGYTVVLNRPADRVYAEGYMEQVKKWLEAGLSGFLVRNLESYSALAQMRLADKCVLDHSLYTWNDEAIRFWKDQGILRNTVPLELNEKELRHRENAGSEMIVYGRLPLMHSAQCVRKNTFGCNGQEESTTLSPISGGLSMMQ